MILLILLTSGSSTPVFAREILTASAASLTPTNPQSKPTFQPISWNDFEKAVRLYHEARLKEASELLNQIYHLKLTTRQNRLVRFLAGVIADSLNNHKKALRMFSTKVTVLSALDSYALFYRARSFYGIGRFTEAIRLLSRYIRLYPEGIFNRQACLLRAESFARLGQTGKAVKEYQKLVRQDEEGETYLGLARLLESQGKIDAAREFFLKAMQRARSLHIRKEAHLKYKELLKLGLRRTGGENLKLETVRLLLMEWRLNEALQTAEQAISEGGSPEYLDELAIEKGRALRYLNRIDLAAEQCRHAARSATSQYKAQLLELYARCLRDQDLFEQAARAYISSGEAAIYKSEADSAYFLAGVLFLKADKKNAAQAAWHRIRPHVRHGRLADDILWYSAWYYYRHQSWNMAAERFLTLSRKYPSRMRGQAAQYWLARTLERLGCQLKAQEHYLALAAGPGPDYYRFLSLKRLRRLNPQGRWVNHPGVKDLQAFKRSGKIEGFLEKPSPVFFWSRLAHAAEDKTHALSNIWVERAKIVDLKPVPYASIKFKLGLTRLKNLAAAGVLDLVYQEAEYIQGLISSEMKRNSLKLTRRQKQRRNAALKRVRDVLFSFSSEYLAELSDYTQYVKLQTRYQTLTNSSSDNEAYEAHRRLYPLPYLKRVSREANKRGLDPALVLAVIRAESYYDAKVTSNSNAIGLMQILPSTGRIIANYLNLPAFKSDDLFDPTVNISIGTWYLAALLKEFKGQVPLALAAYNAGPFHVKRWIRWAGQVDLEEFIDRIPFIQTQVYVKKILGYYYRYHSLYFGKILDLELRAPLNKNHLDLVNF